MPWNGSGTFSRTNGVNSGATTWQQDRDAATKIVADRHDTHDQDIADGINNALAKDGQNAATNDLDIGTNKLKAVKNATLRTDAANTAQIQDGKLNWVGGGGTADAITATYSPAVTALVDGQECYARATAANATTTPTFKANGTTAHTIVKTGGTALVAGDIVGDGHELHFRYDLSGTQWELLNPAKTGASTALDNLAAVAINTSLISDTDNTDDLGSASKGWKDVYLRTGKFDGATSGTTTVEATAAAGTTTITLPAATDTLVGKATTDTFTNKTIDADGTGNVITNIGSSEVKSEMITGQDDGTIAAGDSILFSDVDDSGNLKDDTVQGILNLVPAGGFTLSTEQATTSGTSVTFGSIPAGTKMIVIMFEGVSFLGAGKLDITIGDAGGLETSGYDSTLIFHTGTNAAVSGSTTAFEFGDAGGTNAVVGTMTLTLKNAAAFTWMATGSSQPDSGNFTTQAGVKSLSAELTQLSISGGTFDAGSINIQYQ